MAQAKRPARKPGGIRRRVRIMMSHTWLLVSGALLALAGVTAFAFYLYTQPTTLKIAVGCV